MDCWQTLGIERTSDKRAIKRAYAKLIKQNSPEDDPRAFQRIREAYDQALSLAEHLGGQPDLRASPVRPAYPIALEPLQAPPNRQAEWLNEKDKLRAEQAERISGAIGELLPLFESDVDSAIEYCQAVLEDDYFLALDVRYEFEGRLIIALLQADLYHFKFFDYLAQEFSWDIDLKRKGFFVADHFEGDARYAGAFHSLTRPYLFDLIRQDLRRHFRITSEREEMTYQKMEELLFTEGKEEELETFCARPELKKFVRTAHQYLSRNGYITPYFSVVPPATTQWLRSNNIIASTAPAGESDKAKPKGGTGSTVMLWVAIIVVIRVVIGLIDNRTPEYRADDLERLQSVWDSNALPGQVERIANLGDAKAQFWLGLSYLAGENGFDVDAVKAREWMEKAADQNLAEAQLWLSQLYRSGLGVDADLVTANRLLASAQTRASAAHINNFAWALTQYPDPNFRDGPLAVRLMETVLQAGENRRFAYLDTLAAAYFEAGDYTRAERTQREAMELQQSDTPTEERQRAEARWHRYREAAGLR